jgi:hypothetical protein
MVTLWAGASSLSRLIQSSRVFGAASPWPIRNSPGPMRTSFILSELVKCCSVGSAGRQGVPAGATYADALQVQQWMDRLESGLGSGQTTR